MENDRSNQKDQTSKFEHAQSNKHESPFKEPLKDEQNQPPDPQTEAELEQERKEALTERD